MRNLHGDFETYSAAPLKKCGAYRYAKHATTEILCFCWKIDSGKVETWVPCITTTQAATHKFLPKDWHYGKTVPATLNGAIKAGDTFTAHNAGFERAIWQSVVVPRHGGAATRPTQFVCTATRAAASGLPRALGPLAHTLGTAPKNPEGDRLLKMFAQPRKPTKADARTRIMPLDDVVSFVALVKYCQDDVVAESEVDVIVPHFTDGEQRLFAFDMVINERGFRLDIPLVKKAQTVLAALEGKIVEEVRRITKSEVYPEGLKPTQRDKMLKFFQAMGVALENLQADHVRKYMKTHVKTLKPEAKRLLQLRIEAGKSSTKKLVSMMHYATLEDPVARGTLMMYGAHTGRWSGKGVQPHNFIRGLLKWAEQQRVFKLLDMEDHEVFELLYEWPISIISSCMRGFIIPNKGKIFRVVDYASIEARVLSWLADDTQMLVAFRKGIDVYKLMAAALYGVDIEEVTSEQRRIGKNLVLGAGYGLGATKFVAYSEKAGVEIGEDFAKKAIKAYRTERHKVVRLWGDVERCAITAVRERRSAANAVILRNLHFYIEDRWFCIRLPSGRVLRYYAPRVSPVEKWGEPALQLSYKSEIRGRMYPETTYGGKLVENITQAVARDVLVHGMFSAEKAGYMVHGTVHDEILTEQAIDAGSIHELEEIVCKLPTWANGLPISAEGFESPRYRKG